MIEYFVEVPNKAIQEPVRSLDDAYPLCYDLAQEFGFAEVCWYALNGKRVTEGSYSDKDQGGGRLNCYYCISIIKL